MSFHSQLSSRIEAARSRVNNTAEPTENFRATFAARALRGALLVEEPASVSDALAHVRELRALVGELPTDDDYFAWQIEPVRSALRAIEDFLEAPAERREGGEIILAAAAELEATWQAHGVPPADLAGPQAEKLVQRGDALERTILTVAPCSIAQAAIVMDIVLRWVRDLCGPEWSGISHQLEMLEQGSTNASRGLHRIAGMPLPLDRPSFALMLITDRHS